MQNKGMHLAELNVGQLLAPIDDPRIDGFRTALERINAIAERSPGFVWRLTGEGDDATDVPVSDDHLTIPNMSVWENVEKLEHFVWNTVHKAFYERRQEWFGLLGDMHFVMWWVKAGHEPTLDEAMERLTHLRENGDSDHAFGWKYLEEARLWRSQQCDVAAE